MADTLDQDVQALKVWLDKAWRYVAAPSLSRFERREMRNQMKRAEETLRLALGKVAARDRAKSQRYDEDVKPRSRPNMRLLGLEL
jgi:hypothetical protein